MIELLLGNEALAKGAYEAGVRVATAYPGTPSTEIIENCSRYPEIYTEWSPNEKVALEVGIGASMGGARTLVAMKHVGVNVAADPLFTFSYTGVNGGMVLVTADDPGMHSSQNEQDNRGYARMAKLPMLEPSDSQEIKDMVGIALEISEAFDTPVFLRLTTRLAHSMGLVSTTGKRQEVPVRPYTKDAPKYVMLPGHARARHVKVEERMAALREYAEKTRMNRIEWGDREIGIITSGVVYQYAREIMPQASFLKLGMTYPLPQKMIEEFVAGVKKVYVIEELEPILEEQIRSWGLSVIGKEIFSRMGEITPEIIADKLLGIKAESAYAVTETLPARPPVMCPGCPHRGIFYQLNRMKITVSGDIGCYTLGALPPLAGMDSCVCMGGSIGMALGMEKAQGRDFARRQVAVIGDSTFVHSGITPLIDVVYNKGTTTVLILDNGTTAMTGHQDHPGTGYTVSGQEAFKLDLEKLVRAVGIKRVRVIDPLDLKQTREALKEELAAEEPSVIIAQRPCVLLEKPSGIVYTVDDRCTGCKVCLRTGCPGLEFRDEVVTINPLQCSGCGLCAQVCAFEAIQKAGGSQAGGEQSGK
jgi:indolepyruvate ferredoxin oxidoreductase alpha subunit